MSVSLVGGPLDPVVPEVEKAKSEVVDDESEFTFGEAGDKYLEEFYAKYGSTTWEQKLNLHNLVNDAESCCRADTMTNVRLLEMELLQREKIIPLILC